MTVNKRRRNRDPHEGTDLDDPQEGAWSSNPYTWREARNAFAVAAAKKSLSSTTSEEHRIA